MVSLCQVVSGNSGIRSRKGQKQEENYDHSKDIFYKREPILVDQNQRTDQYQNHDGQCPQDKYPQEGQAVGRNIKDHPVSTGGDHQTGAGTDKGKQSLQKPVFCKQPAAQKNEKDIKQTHK